MARKEKLKRDKKIRTRDHVIADLSVNYVERFALLNNYSVEIFVKDYGYDLNIYTYSDKGEIETCNIYMQLKATDKIKLIRKNRFASFSIDKRDLNLWLEEPMPCILVLYDAINNKAYWSYLQATLENHPSFDINNVKERYSINIPVSNRINKSSLKRFRSFKVKVLDQIKGKISHEE